MAISVVPFALQNVPINADVVRQAISSLLPNAGGILTVGDFAVTQTGTPSMGVSVGVGRAWVPGTNVAVLTGTTYSKQGQYFVLNDAPVTVTINTADATNPRIDVVYISISDAAYFGTLNSAQITVATGIPNISPSAPALPTNAIPLAQVAVAAGATSILTANVTTTAVSIKVAAQQWDRSSTTNDAMTAGDSVLITGTIANAPAGQYRIDGVVCCYGNTSAVGSVFVKGGTTKYSRRWDLPNNTAISPTCMAIYTHPGGTLTVSTGYTVVSGTAAVGATTTGYTSVFATFIG